MQSKFIINSNSKKIIIIFSGWSIKPEIYKKIKFSDYDLLVLYNYRDLYLDLDILKNYKEINIIAYSLGVWIANYFFSLNANALNDNIILNKTIAINGTISPIDNSRGIPEKTFSRTIETLSEESLRKFHLRMCGDKKKYEEFIKLNSNQDINSLESELKFIQEKYKDSLSLNNNNKTNNNIYWHKIYIGTLDKIFPLENQLNAWKESPNKEILEIPHYDFDTMKNIICSL